MVAAQQVAGVWSLTGQHPDAAATGHFASRQSCLLLGGRMPPLTQEISMQVGNSSAFPSLALWFTSLCAAATRLARPVSAKRLVPPDSAPPAHQRLTLPFKRPGSTPRRCLAASSFRPAPPEVQKPGMTRLKVVREHDANMGPACAGRMMISGRMADVCAELERMTEH